MAQVIERMYDDKDKKLVEYITPETKRILIIFWHGVGDAVMFFKPFEALKQQFPAIHFDLAFAKGLTQEVMYPGALLVTGDDLKDDKLKAMDYDIVAKVHFPMNEAQQEFTKGEWCCIKELGIEPVWGHSALPECQNRLVGVHFNITCLPGAANPDEETAKRVWNDILEAGYIPIETHFEHVFHNPVNKKFDFVDCTVRRAKAEVDSLIGLIRNLGAFVGVVSGNFHIALATLPPERIFFLEKDFKLECFTKHPIARADIHPGKYNGEVKLWLMNDCQEIIREAKDE